MYGFIAAMWIVAALVLLAFNGLRASRNLKVVTRQAKELKQLNRLLNVETESLKNMAERDPLTGALNRSGIKPIFTQELKLLSLIFMDIDHFKQINDRHGHGMGDAVLKEVVRLVQYNCRATDCLARWGGEEFLLVCPNTDSFAAQDLAESLRLLIEENHWVHDERLTASFGVAQRLNETNSDFIKRADMALYDAKAQGRNRVVVALD